MMADMVKINSSLPKDNLSVFIAFITTGSASTHLRNVIFNVLLSHQVKLYQIPEDLVSNIDALEKDYEDLSKIRDNTEDEWMNRIAELMTVDEVLSS